MYYVMMIYCLKESGPASSDNDSDRDNDTDLEILKLSEVFKCNQCV